MTEKALTVVDPGTIATLYGTDDPQLIVQKARAKAVALADVVKDRGLASNIQGKDYVHVEGWTFLGSMCGVFPVTVWTRPFGNGWEARVEARTLGGEIVGAAEAECTREEPSWKDRPDYALRSMAQTRATSKALRMPLGYIMTLAGYSATPYEEMAGISEPHARPAQDTGLGICPVHKKPFVPGQYGPYCKNKNDDGSWCKQKPGKVKPEPKKSEAVETTVREIPDEPEGLEFFDDAEEMGEPATKQKPYEQMTGIEKCNALLELARIKDKALPALLREWKKAGTYSSASLSGLKVEELDAIKKWLDGQ